MGELRRDPIVGRWVIVNVEGAFEPSSFEKEEHEFKQERTCQFCWGHEHLTPPEIEVLRPPHSGANTAGWAVRVIANKFPALRIEGELNRRGIGIFDTS